MQRRGQVEINPTAAHRLQLLRRIFNDLTLRASRLNDRCPQIGMRWSESPRRVRASYFEAIDGPMFYAMRTAQAMLPRSRAERALVGLDLFAPFDARPDILRRAGPVLQGHR